MLARGAAAFVLGLVLVPAAVGATVPTRPVYDASGHLIEIPSSCRGTAQAGEEEATNALLAFPKVSGG